MQVFLEQTLNGVTFAGLLFVLASGFALTFGLLRVANITHGSAFLVGGSVGWSVEQAGGGFWLALLAASVSMGIAGILLERALLRRLQGDEMAQFLLTVGVSFVVADFALAVWGGAPLSIQLPHFLSQSWHAGTVTYPWSRIFVLGAAVALGMCLWLLLGRTRLGAIVRAGVDDPEMVSALGINIGLVFTLVFGLGMLLAGFAGVLGGSILAIGPGGDWEILIYVFAIVVIGGRGSLGWAMVGSLVIGLVNTYGVAYFPSFEYFSLFAPLALILVLRPQGLFGR